MNLDKLIPGAISGLIGGVVMVILDFPFKVLTHSNQGFIDLAQIFIMFQTTKGFISFFVGLIAHLVMTMNFGIIYMYIILKSSERLYLLKGIGLGLTTWFLLIVPTTLFKVPGFTIIPSITAFYHMIVSALFGIITIYAIKLLTKKI